MRWKALLGLVALWSIHHVLPGQETSFREDVRVVVVEVPVQVLRKGEPVRGLTAADFLIYDRGEQREITDFEVLDLTSVGPRGEAVRSAAASAVPGMLPARARQFLLLFDLHYSTPRFLLRGLRAAEEMLVEQLTPSDRASVALYTRNGGARLLTGFTTDRNKSSLALQFIEALLDRDQGRTEELAQQLGVIRSDDEGTAALQRLSREVGLTAALAVAGRGLDNRRSDEMRLFAFERSREPEDPEGLLEILNSPVDLYDSGAPELQDLVRAVCDWADGLGELSTLLQDLPSPKTLLLFSLATRRFCSRAPRPGLRSSTA